MTQNELTVLTQNGIIGQNIQQFRNRLGISQAVLSDYLAISREMLSYYETGTRNIPIDVIAKAAKIFGVDEYDLFETQNENLCVNLAFAFRSDDLTVDDLNSIADFKKIILNYLSMKKVVVDADDKIPSSD